MSFISLGLSAYAMPVIGFWVFVKIHAFMVWKNRGKMCFFVYFNDGVCFHLKKAISLRNNGVYDCGKSEEY